MHVIHTITHALMTNQSTHAVWACVLCVLADMQQITAVVLDVKIAPVFNAYLGANL